MTSEETLTPGEIVRRWGKSDSSVRRALVAEKLPGAIKGEESWEIPLSSVIALYGPEPARGIKETKRGEELAREVAELRGKLEQLPEIEIELAVLRERTRLLEEQLAKSDEQLAKGQELIALALKNQEEIGKLTSGIAGLLTRAPQLEITPTEKPRRRFFGREK